MNGVSSSIRGGETLIGSLLESNTQEGHGIWIQNSHPTIEDVTVKNHNGDGIHVEDTAATTVNTNELELYTGGEYDHRLTSDKETSVQHRVEVYGETLYLAYLNEESNSIYLKKSGDKGFSWCDPILVAQPSEEIERIDMAVDRDSLLVMYTDSTYFHFIHSSDRGETWELDENEYEYCGASPSIDIERDHIYVCAVKSLPKGQMGVVGEILFIDDCIL